MNATKLITQGIIAFLIRLWLLTSEFKKPVTNRIEISTPLNSWKRVSEGVYLLNENADPYEGDPIHEPPLILHLYKFLINYCQDYLLYIFVFCDMLTAIFLYSTTKRYLQIAYSQQKAILKQNRNLISQNGDSGDYKEDCEDTFYLTKLAIEKGPSYVFAAYLFNPYVIFNCIAMTTTVFSNLLLAIFLLCLVYRWHHSSCIILALSATQTMYTAILITAILINVNLNKKVNKIKTALCACTFIGCFVICQYISFLLSNSWKFLENTYGFIFLIPDLQPNIGLFWYFFTEMFEHFRALFIAAFQINVSFLYLIPLSIRFRKDPVLLSTSLIILIAIFKSYPSLGDVGFCLSLIPIWTYLFRYLQQAFIVVCCFLITTVLGPVVWHLWIYSRSANANFYFGVTLSFATAQIFLITDLLFIIIKTEFWLKNSHIRNINSNSAKLTLE